MIALLALCLAMCNEREGCLWSIVNETSDDSEACNDETNEVRFYNGIVEGKTIYSPEIILQEPLNIFCYDRHLVTGNGDIVSHFESPDRQISSSKNVITDVKISLLRTKYRNHNIYTIQIIAKVLQHNAKTGMSLLLITYSVQGDSSFERLELLRIPEIFPTPISIGGPKYLVPETRENLSFERIKSALFT